MYRPFLRRWCTRDGLGLRVSFLYLCTLTAADIRYVDSTADFPYLIDPLAAIKSRSSTDGTTITQSLNDNDTTAAKTAATGKDVAIVFITADSGEGYLTVEGNAGDRYVVVGGGDVTLTRVQ